MLERLPRLRLILATGMRNERSVDLAAAREFGITVYATRTHQFPIVELTWAMILSLFRCVHREPASVRNGGWQLQLGQGLSGRVLGVLGLGTMGVAVARVGLALGMQVIAWSPATVRPAGTRRWTNAGFACAIRASAPPTGRPDDH